MARLEQNVKQEAINFSNEDRLLGILTIPKNHDFTIHPIVLILNAGLLHRVGSNRMGTNLAFKLAENSIASFRFDFSGIGDSRNSDTDIDTAQLFINDTNDAIDYLKNEYGIKEYILFGLCSGAEVAFEVALNNQVITGICLVNGTTIKLKEIGISYQTIKSLTERRYLMKNLLNLFNWLNFLKSGNLHTSINKKSAKKFLRKAKLIFLKKLDARNNEVIKTTITLGENKFSNWEKILERDIHIFQIFSEGSSSLDIYNYNKLDKFLLKKQKLQKLSVKIIKDVDHNFTPLWSQQLLLNSVTKWITNLQ